MGPLPFSYGTKQMGFWDHHMGQSNKVPNQVSKERRGKILYDFWYQVIMIAYVHGQIDSNALHALFKQIIHECQWSSFKI